MDHLPISISEKLRPWQVKPVENLVSILRTHGSALDLSQTGTGKSFHAVATAVSLGLPCLVVAPKVSLTAWERVAEHFNDRLSIVGWEALRTGNTLFGSWENGSPPPASEREFFKCEICQRVVDFKKFLPCPHHALGIHCLNVKRKAHRYGKFIFHPGVKMVVYDEIHRANHDSLNSELVIAARRANLVTLGLSATPASSPLHLRALGYLVGLHKLGDYERWLYRLGCRREPMRGWVWRVSVEDQQRIMRDIRAQIIPERGIRITTDQIPDFPANHISAELIDLPAKGTEELNALYAEIADSYNSLQERAALDANPELPLTKRLRARQAVELLKIPGAAELGKDYLEKNHSVVWFVNFRATIDELLKRFPNARVIDGTDVKNRQRVVDGFQRNDFRELIVNNMAGGICLSLQDLLGDYPRVGLVFPSDSAVVMRQLFGRLARDGGKSSAYYRVLFASKSVEVPMRRALASKLNCLDSLTSGYLNPENLVLKS